MERSQRKEDGLKKQLEEALKEVHGFYMCVKVGGHYVTLGLPRCCISFLMCHLSVCLLLLQHRRVIEELKHEREGFQEVLQAKDKELEVTKVLIPVEMIHV